MFKQIVMQVSGLMERLFMGRFLSMEQQLLLNAKPLPVKLSQESQKPVQQPAPQSRKRKPSVVQSTKQVKSRKQTPKPAQTTSGKDGSQPVTPASKTRQPASKQQTAKQKPAVSTKVVKKRTPGQTPAATPTARKSKARGS